MVHPCSACDKPSTRRCSGCKTPTAWYCSEECQRSLWVLHIFECNPKKPIKTAYHLARAAYQDCFPDDPQTCEDYGFERAFTPQNRSNLLGLYMGLILYNKVDPKAIHRWRQQGKLVEEIKATFEKLPAESRGGYYPWFLQNQWVLDHTLHPPTDAFQEMMLRAWQYAGGAPSATSEEMDVTRNNWPKYKQECFGFCAVLLSDWHPSPHQGIWLKFGFCVCPDEFSEGLLARLYKELIARCSFDELCTAYNSSSLIALFDANGLDHEREQFPHLEDILSESLEVRKSVWDLKQYVVVKDSNLIPSIGVDYGFFNCTGERERLELKEVYKQFFDRRDADMPKLHEACIGGRLFEYVGEFVKLKNKFSRLMKNPYPLLDV